MTSQSCVSHAQHVKEFFEAPDGYFGRRGFDVRIRVQTIRAFTEGTVVGQILDIGCGNGEITIPLLELPGCQDLTLLDLSSKMLELAKSRLKPDGKDRVTFINDDFLAVDFAEKSFDLIVCVGVFAHVDSPNALIEKMVSLLKPAGRLVFEVTDSFHPVGRVLTLYHTLLSWIRPSAYPLNRLRIKEIVKTCLAYGLIQSSSFRYCLPPPGSQRIFSHDSLYRMVRAVFGQAGSNRRGWLGNVALCQFHKPEQRASSKVPADGRLACNPLIPIDCD